jgi:hypothetical protein
MRDMDDQLEGWCTDPFGRHEARWLSQGVPTKLVRDGGVESYEAPPDEPPSQAAVLIEAPPSRASADVGREDEAVEEGAFNQAEAAMRRAWGEFDPH